MRQNVSRFLVDCRFSAWNCRLRIDWESTFVFHFPCVKMYKTPRQTIVLRTDREFTFLFHFPCVKMYRAPWWDSFFQRAIAVCGTNWELTFHACMMFLCGILFFCMKLSSYFWFSRRILQGYGEIPRHVHQVLIVKICSFRVGEIISAQSM